MSNIILRREAQRLEQMAIARIWGPVIFKLAGKAMAILTESLAGMTISIGRAMTATKGLKDLLIALTDAWKGLPLWRRIWLRICIWISE